MQTRLNLPVYHDSSCWQSCAQHLSLLKHRDGFTVIQNAICWEVTHPTVMNDSSSTSVANSDHVQDGASCVGGHPLA